MGVWFKDGGKQPMYGRKIPRAAVLAGFVLASVFSGQEQSPVGLTVREIRSGAEARPELEIEYENRSGKVIAAYVVRVDHCDEKGKLVIRESLTSITKDLGLTKGRPGFAPGERWTERTAIRVEEARRDVVLDLVIYADGSHWGPNKARRLDYLMGIKTGAHMERSP